MKTKLCLITNTGALYKSILLNVEVRPSTRNFKINDLTRVDALCVRYTWAQSTCGAAAALSRAARPEEPCSPTAASR